MAALSKRDIEMIFRAETDAATRPVNELTSDVKRLRTTLEDLTKASGKSEKSLDDLAKTTRELQKAQEEIGTARTLLTQLNGQAVALERAEAAAEKAAQKYRGLKEQVDGAEQPTKRLVNSLAAAERGMNATNARLDEAQKNFKEVKTSVESIIGPVDNLDDAFRKVAVAQREITQGLSTAKGSVAEFKAEVVQADAAASKLAANDAFKQAGLNAGLPAAQVDYISQFENRVELLTQARREMLAQDAAFQRALEAQAAKVGAANVAQLKQQFEDTQIAAARLEQVDVFRKMAADTLAANTAAQRIKDTTDSSATSAQRLADAVLGLVNPAQAAAVSIGGIDARLDAVIAKMAGGKISVNEWNNLNNELQSIQASLIRASAEVDKFTAQQAKVDDAAAAYDRQAQKVRELAAADVAASVSVEELTADLAREEAVLARLGSALDRETVNLNEFGAALKRVGVDSANLPQAIGQIESSARRAAPAIQRVASAVSPAGRKGFLGLDPFQLQNLSFQVNDVFTSLASGISPMQTLAQQGGQIVQIFPGILSSMAALLPVIVPLAAGFAVLAGSIAEANFQTSSLRELTATLSGLGETNGYDTAKMQQIVKDFRDIGVSADDALKATKVFVKEGLNPKAVDDYIIAAKNLADVNGTEVAPAVEEITKAFTRGAEEVLALDDKYGFLTDTQRTNLEASKDTKEEYDEVNKAFSALYTKMQKASNDMRGPFADSSDLLRQSWRDLLETFADTGVIDSVNKIIANAITGFSYLINLARRTAGLANNINKAINDNSNFIDRGRAIAGLDFNIGGQAERDTIAQMQRSRRAQTQAQTAPGADAGLGSAGRQKENEEDAKKARAQAEKDRKKAAKDAAADAKRREAEAKRLAKQYANEQDQLTSALSRFTVEAMKGQQAPLEAQLGLAKQAVDEQFKALEDRLSEFNEKFGDKALVNGMSQADYRASLNAQKQQITLNRQLGVYESNVNDLLKERETRLKSIQEQQSVGLLTAQQALDKTREVTSDMGPKIDQAIVSARAFIAALTPSAETQALLAKFDTIGAQQKGDTIARKSADTGYQAEEQKLNDIFQRRAALVEAANRLYDLGVINFTEKEARIKAAYTDTTKALNTQIEAMRAYLVANQNLFPPEVFARAMADLDAYNAQLTYTNTLTTAVKQSAEQAIAGGLMNMFDTLAQGIANIITGAGSLKDLFADLGMAALNFAATFAKAIADAIIQIYALRIAKSLVGGFHGGGTVGDYGGGVMKLSRNIGMPDLSGVPRYHNGTQGAGLKNNEMLAVLETGEKVSTEEQQRLEKNRLAAARKGGSGMGIRQVLAIGDEEVANAMSGTAGEETVVTILQRRKSTIKQVLGIGN